MCDRIYIIDNGIVIGEKTIEQAKVSENEEIFSYSFVTSDNGRVMSTLKNLIPTASSATTA